MNVLAVAEAVFDEAHASNPLHYAMWSKNADPAADPHAYLFAYQHPDGEWGEVHGFANGYRDPAKVAELIDQAAVELDPEKRAAIYAELQRMLFDDPMWLIAAQEGVAMAHRDWVQSFVMQPLWPRPEPEVRAVQQVDEPSMQPESTCAVRPHGWTRRSLRIDRCGESRPSMQIRDYILRRLMVLPILIVGTSIVVFALSRVGGSPIGIYLSHEMSPAEVARDRGALPSRTSRCRSSISTGRRGVLTGDLGWSGVAAAPVDRGLPEQARRHAGAGDRRRA